MQIDGHGASIYQFPVADAAKQSPTEEAGARQITEVGAPAASKEAPRGFLGVARRNLTAEELASPGVQRFLIAEIERLDAQCADSQHFVTQYHEQRVTIAALSEQSKTNTWNEVLFIACISVGSGGLGAAPAYFSIEKGFWPGMVVLVLSVALIGLSAASRIWK